MDDMDELTQEGKRLLNLIGRASNYPGDRRFTAADIAFVRSLRERTDVSLSRKQVYWLRDIADKCEL